MLVVTCESVVLLVLVTEYVLLHRAQVPENIVVKLIAKSRGASILQSWVQTNPARWGFHQADLERLL